MLSFGSLSHYAEPSYYDKCYANRRDDVAFYLDRANRKPPCAILEYGCGNGRIALPIAQAGHQITGVDLSQPMLSAFAERLKSEPNDVQQRV
ncbi:MAG: hypothetical protein CSA75_05425, partial [Sorangium cellulosum]